MERTKVWRTMSPISATRKHYGVYLQHLGDNLVNASSNKSFPRSDVVPPTTNDDCILNPAGRLQSNSWPMKWPKQGLFRPSKPFIKSTLNCRSLYSNSPQAELNKLMTNYNISLTCVQEHHYFHLDDEPDIRSHDIWDCTLFTTSAVRNLSSASIGGVRIAVRISSFPLVISISARIVMFILKGNPKTVIVSCHAPHSNRPERDYETLRGATRGGKLGRF